MPTIEEVKDRLKQNGMIGASQQMGTTQAPAITTQAVQDAIRKESQRIDQVREKAKQGQLRGEDFGSVIQQQKTNAGANAALQTGDNLQQMIKEAQLQTEALTKPKGVVGGDADLAGSGQKLQQLAALQPQNEAETPWVDSSYFTPEPDAGITRMGKTIAEGAGNVITDAEGLRWMVRQNGGLQQVDNMTDAELQQLQNQMRDTSYQVTGRVYGLNPDGTTPQWLSVGDQVVTAGGTYIITGHKFDGGYTSELYDPNQTTESFRGNYNTGTYGSILGERNPYADSFKGNRESQGEFTGYGGYSMNPNGKMQFDTMSKSFDGSLIRTAIQDGKAYKLGLNGSLEPLEAGSLVQDASQRYWIVGADGTMLDVTPANPMNNPLNDGLVQQKQKEEARKAGIDVNRKSGRTRTTPLDPATQAQIDQLELQLQREQAALEGANRELYRQYRLEQNQLQDQLVGGGLSTTGAAEKAQAGLTADYLSKMNANEQSRRTAEEDAAYRIQLATLQAQQEADAQSRQQLQQKAENLAKYGDFSGYQELGYTGDQIASMQNAYAKENSPDTTYEGLSDYAMTLLNLYQANPAYNIDMGLQEALQSGLITEQDYLAARQAAAGIAR